ncbi:hypothetical protein AYO41_04960 [Verrucomicrobia bacterium SCGC AG-212-E04]|nr:hypothetical protein AYO41_04960 [Verrucomicrobia bacterium SCGC AG-212-E04]
MGLARPALLQFISAAQQAGAKTIFGLVTSDDLQNTPHLLALYRQVGFEVVPPTSDDLDGAAYRIQMFFTAQSIG